MTTTSSSIVIESSGPLVRMHRKADELASSHPRSQANLKREITDWLEGVLNNHDGGLLAHDFVFAGLRKQEVLNRLFAHYEPTQAMELMTSVEALVAKLPKRTDLLDHFLAITRKIQEESTLPASPKAKSPPADSTKAQGKNLKFRLVQWLDNKLPDSPSYLVRNFIYDGMGRKLVQERLVARFGNTEAARIMAGLDSILTVLRPRTNPLVNHFDAARALEEKQANRTISTRASSQQRQHIRTKAHLALAHRLGGGKEDTIVAHDFFYANKGGDLIARRLKERLGEDSGRELMVLLDQLRTSLERLSLPYSNPKADEFPFTFKWKNLLRDYSPRGFTQVAQTEVNKDEVRRALDGTITTNVPPTILSIFSEKGTSADGVALAGTHKTGPTGDLYIVFEEGEGKRRRGLARFSSDRTMTAVRVFNGPPGKSHRKH